MGFASLTIDCQTIKENIKKIKASIPTSPNVLLIAKANAYGLGAAQICNELTSIVDCIGVATVQEAAELRNHGIATPILLLSEPFEFELPIVAALDMAVTVYDTSTIDQISNYTTQHNQPIKTHLKIDTGMTRLGVPWQTANDALNHWHQTPDTVIKEGVYSHFANSDDANHPLNQSQVDRFLSQQTNFKSQMTHFSNSDALNNIKASHLDTIRIGLAAYNNSFTLSAPIRHIQTIPANTSIGYGSTYTSSTTTTIAVIGMGYADGLSTQLSNQGHVMINQTECPIIGKVCMDMFMVELPSPTLANVDDIAIILSPDAAPGMNLSTMAELTNQNPREVMTRLSSRVTRHHITK